MNTSKSNKTRELFAARLRAFRRDAGFKTARMFAKTLGIDENRYTRYERAEVEPDLSLIARFCETLKVTPNKLLGFDDFPVFPETDRYTVPGFAEPGNPSLGSSLRPVTTEAPAVRPQPEPYSEAVRLAAWRVAEARARIGGEDASAARILRRTAQLYDELMTDPVGAIARVALHPEIDRAPDDEQTAFAECVDALLTAVRQSRIGSQ